MGRLIVVDFLFARLCRAVKEWYDKYYFGTDKEQKKQKHLNRLEVLYMQKSDWSDDPRILNQQVEEFLTYVQGKVNGYGF